MVVMIMVMLVVVVVMVGKMISDVCHCDCNCDQVSAIVMGFREAIKEEEEKEKEHLNDWRWFSSENFPFLKLDAFKHLTEVCLHFCSALRTIGKRVGANVLFIICLVVR